MLTKFRALTDHRAAGSVHHQGGVDNTCLHIHLLQLGLALRLGKLASVAHGSERVVVVEALLADPVALLLTFLCVLLDLAPFAIFCLHNGFFGASDRHVLGLALNVISALRLLASMTVLTALEVVVLALGAFPATIRELIVVLFLLLSLR